MLVGTTGGLEDDRSAGPAHDLGQQVGVDPPRSDVGVAVGTGVELVATVVAVDQVDAPGDDPHLVDHRLQRDAPGHWA